MDNVQINRMRATASAKLMSEAVIMRPQLVSDDGGGYETTWEDETNWNEAGMYPCNYAPTRSDRGYAENPLADMIATSAPWTFTFEHDADVRRDDRIVVDARTFEVALVMERSRPLITIRALCKEVV